MQFLTLSPPLSPESSLERKYIKVSPLARRFKSTRLFSGSLNVSRFPGCRASKGFARSRHTPNWFSYQEFQGHFKDIFRRIIIIFGFGLICQIPQRQWYVLVPLVILLNFAAQMSLFQSSIKYFTSVVLRVVVVFLLDVATFVVFLVVVHAFVLFLSCKSSVIVL